MLYRTSWQRLPSKAISKRSDYNSNEYNGFTQRVKRSVLIITPLGVVVLRISIPQTI